MESLVKITVWIAVNKDTLKPTAVKEYMEDLPFANHWLVECDLELPLRKKNK